MTEKQGFRVIQCLYQCKSVFNKMSLFIYNTLSGKKEIFSPVDGKRVNMYVCGITPYDESHLGHARCYVIFDVIYRFLKYFIYGYIFF